MSSIRGIAVDQAARKMYWTYTNLQIGPGILRSDLTGSQTEFITQFSAQSQDTPFDIVLDPGDSTLYYTNFAGAQSPLMLLPALPVPGALILILRWG